MKLNHRSSVSPHYLSRLIQVLLLAAACLASPGRASAQSTLTILHNFGDGTVANDGLGPESALILGSDGNFYGTTGAGGSAGNGTVFRMTPSGAVTILHSFGDGSVANDGEGPNGVILAGDGNFYGTTVGGGAGVSSKSSKGLGTVFRMTPSGAVTILHSFGDGTVANDGINPLAGLVQGSDGNFYGTTAQGGSTVSLTEQLDVSAVGYGTAFVITPSGTETILHNFGDGSVANDGTNSQAALIQGSDGNFYGTTSLGGSTDNGAVFRMTPSGAVTILHSFYDGTVADDGQGPIAPLTLGNDGNFYGTTTFGGGAAPTPTIVVLHAALSAESAGEGTVFKITPSGAVTILHGFGDGTVADDGLEPFSGLIQGSDGNFYGATTQGGSTFGSAVTDGQGTLFQITPTGAETILHNFGDGSVANDGEFPYGGLIEGSDGNLYGTTVAGGSTAAAVKGDKASGDGTAFKLVTNLTPPTTTTTPPTTTTTYYTFPAGQQMLSVPAAYPSGTIFSQILTTTNSPDLVYWNPADTPQANYIPASLFNPGQSYWARFLNPTPLISAGTPVTESPFAIALSPGWNMIADPYATAVSLSSVTVTAGASSYSFLNADNQAALIYAELYTYPAGATAYQEVGPTGSLQPYAGYWIYALKSCTLNVSAPTD